MTTNLGETRHGLPRGIDHLGMTSTHASQNEAATRETRLKRLILVGALASFLSIFGLTIAVDHQQAQVSSETTNVSANAPLVQRNSAAGIAQPQIRTRTS